MGLRTSAGSGDGGQLAKDSGSEPSASPTATTSGPESGLLRQSPHAFEEGRGGDQDDRTPRPSLLEFSPAAAGAHIRVLGVVGFAMIAFNLTGGGPFGLELSVQYAGPLPCFLAFLVLPFIWSLPQALITAELACMMPGNGGAILWCSSAFGDLGGWIVGFNSLASSIIDLALYPVMFASYVVMLLEGGGAGGAASGDDDADAAAAAASSVSRTELCARLAVIAVGLALNVRGIAVVSRFSGAVIALVLAPFVVSFVAQAPAVWTGGRAWAQVRPAPQWALFSASMLWAHSGWDACGSFAGEVVRPAETFVRGTLLTMALVLVTYALPLLVAVQTHPDYAAWPPGALQVFCGDVAPFLGHLAIGAGLLSQLAMFTSGLSAASRGLWALAGGGEKGVAGVAHLPSLLAREWGGSPVVALVAQAVTVGGLTLLPFESLLQCNLALGSVRILLITGAFLRLRESHADASRPLGGGGGGGGGGGAGGGGALLVAAPLFIVSAAFMALTHAGVWATVAGLNCIALGVFAAHAARDARAYGRWWPRGRFNLVGGGGGPADTSGGKDTSPSAGGALLGGGRGRRGVAGGSGGASVGWSLHGGREEAGGRRARRGALGSGYSSSDDDDDGSDDDEDAGSDDNDGEDDGDGDRDSYDTDDGAPPLTTAVSAGDAAAAAAATYGATAPLSPLSPLSPALSGRSPHSGGPSPRRFAVPPLYERKGGGTVVASPSRGGSSALPPLPLQQQQQPTAGGPFHAHLQPSSAHSSVGEGRRSTTGSPAGGRGAKPRRRRKAAAAAAQSRFAADGAGGEM